MLLTSQMKVKRSCHLAFFGNNVFDPMYAISPTLTMAAKDVAEVCVNGCRVGAEFDMMVNGRS
jgi:hypothetical protein